MLTKYKHGGGYKKAALQEGINWNQVTDYSTSINWKATEFYPDNFIYLHQESTEYPDSDYLELKELIEEYHGYPEKYFLLTHGANEAINAIFHMFLLQGYKNKQVLLVGPTYSEYNKYSDLNGFNSVKISIDEFNNQVSTLKDKIVVIVNPNTPLGLYYDLDEQIQNLLNSGNIVVIDESFIDFTCNASLYKFVEDNPNLYIIHSMTKFYGSAGARLGIILGSNKLLQNCMSVLLPPWTISAYDNWFYRKIIPQYTRIRPATIKWISTINNKADNVIENLKNICSVEQSITSYRTLKINPEILENESDIRKFFLKKYKIFVRPTSDFFRCPEYSFRVGLRLPNENEPLLKALKDIG